MLYLYQSKLRSSKEIGYRAFLQVYILYFFLFFVPRAVAVEAARALPAVPPRPDFVPRPRAGLG